MNDWSIALVILMGVGIAVAVASHEPKTPAATLPTEGPVEITESQTDSLLIFDQPGYRKLHLSKRAISGFNVWPSHPEMGRPAVEFLIGGQLYRLDCTTPQRAEEVGNFITKALGE